MMIASAIVSSMSYNYLVEKFRIRALFRLGLLCNILFHCCFFFILLPSHNPAFYLFLFANSLLGLGFGWFFSSLQALILLGEKRNRNMTRLHCSLAIGSSTAPFLIPIFSKTSEWYLAIALLLFLWILFACVFSFLDLHSKATSKKQIVDSQPLQTSTSLENLKAPAKRNLQTFILFLSIIFVYSLVEASIAYWLPSYLNKIKHLPFELSTISLAVFWGSVSTGRSVMSLFADRMRANVLFACSSVMIALSFILLVCSTSHVSLFIYIAVLGLACSYFFPVSIILAASKSHMHTNLVSSLSLTSLMLGAGLINQVIGRFYSYNIFNLQEIFSGIAVLACLLVVFVLYASFIKE